MNELKASYLDIILAIAEAVDLVSPDVSKHHKQVGVITWNLAKEMGLHDKDTMTTFIAALLHDCGSVALTLDDRLKTLNFDFDNPYRHCVTGYHLLKEFAPLKDVAKIVKYHHSRWFEGSGREKDGEKIPVHSFLIHLADRIAVSINMETELLHDIGKIAIPLEILEKPAPLTKDEFNIISTAVPG